MKFIDKITDIIGAQGELRVYAISGIPEGLTMTPVAKDQHGNHILSHSEKGHHHVLPGDVDVMMHTETIPHDGSSIVMNTLYAIVKEPTALHQTSTDNHKDVALAPGMYAIPIDVEYDPFSKQIAQVRD